MTMTELLRMPPPSELPPAPPMMPEVARGLAERLAEVGRGYRLGGASAAAAFEQQGGKEEKREKEVEAEVEGGETFPTQAIGEVSFLQGFVPTNAAALAWRYDPTSGWFLQPETGELMPKRAFIEQFFSAAALAAYDETCEGRRRRPRMWLQGRRAPPMKRGDVRAFIVMPNGGAFEATLSSKLDGAAISRMINERLKTDEPYQVLVFNPRQFDFDSGIPLENASEYTLTHALAEYLPRFEHVAGDATQYVLPIVVRPVRHGPMRLVRQPLLVDMSLPPAQRMAALVAARAERAERLRELRMNQGRTREERAREWVVSRRAEAAARRAERRATAPTPAERERQGLLLRKYLEPLFEHASTPGGTLTQAELDALVGGLNERLVRGGQEWQDALDAIIERKLLEADRAAAGAAPAPAKTATEGAAAAAAAAFVAGGQRAATGGWLAFLTNLDAQLDDLRERWAHAVRTRDIMPVLDDAGKIVSYEAGDLRQDVDIAMELAPAEPSEPQVVEWAKCTDCGAWRALQPGEHAPGFTIPTRDGPVACKEVGFETSVKLPDGKVARGSVPWGSSYVRAPPTALFPQGETALVDAEPLRDGGWRISGKDYSKDAGLYVSPLVRIDLQSGKVYSDDGEPRATLDGGRLYCVGADGQRRYVPLSQLTGAPVNEPFTCGHEAIDRGPEHAALHRRIAELEREAGSGALPRDRALDALLEAAALRKREGELDEETEEAVHARRAGSVARINAAWESAMESADARILSAVERGSRLIEQEAEAPEPGEEKARGRLRRATEQKLGAEEAALLQMQLLPITPAQLAELSARESAAAARRRAQDIADAEREALLEQKLARASEAEEASMLAQADARIQELQARAVSAGAAGGLSSAEQAELQALLSAERPSSLAEIEARIRELQARGRSAGAAGGLSSDERSELRELLDEQSERQAMLAAAQAPEAALQARTRAARAAVSSLLKSQKSEATKAEEAAQGKAEAAEEEAPVRRKRRRAPARDPSADEPTPTDATDQARASQDAAVDYAWHGSADGIDEARDGDGEDVAPHAGYVGALTRQLNQRIQSLALDNGLGPLAPAAGLAAEQVGQAFLARPDVARALDALPNAYVRALSDPQVSGPPAALLNALLSSAVAAP